MEKDPHHSQDEELKPEQVPLPDSETTQNNLAAPTQANQSTQIGFAPPTRTKAPPTSFHPSNPSWPSWGHPLPCNENPQR